MNTPYQNGRGQRLAQMLQAQSNYGISQNGGVINPGAKQQSTLYRPMPKSPGMTTPMGGTDRSNPYG
jgi:hypothetical protein